MDDRAGDYREYPIVDEGAWLVDGEVGYWRECFKDQLTRANAAEAEVKYLREALEEIHRLYGGSTKAGCIATGALLEVNHGESIRVAGKFGESQITIPKRLTET